MDGYQYAYPRLAASKERLTGKGQTAMLCLFARPVQVSNSHDYQVPCRTLPCGQIRRGTRSDVGVNVSVSVGRTRMDGCVLRGIRSQASMARCG